MQGGICLDGGVGPWSGCVQCPSSPVPCACFEHHKFCPSLMASTLRMKVHFPDISCTSSILYDMERCTCNYTMHNCNVGCS
ncbi:hypothetical protein KOEU_32420 [Komagataeibacter europaeus]|uniref:Uncharacterized protein n=1 Tax=Komagataeibacter europaeus TaxID=33995 RepID=A0A0M0EDE5_KOMEU|nr:hypothetical protein KOEU_32420 [Komagataeibacter europaeus]